MKDDLHWSGVTDFLRQHIRPDEKIIAPNRFKEKFENVYSYSFTHGAEVDYFEWVLVHKGLLEKVNTPFLAQTIRRLQPVFANEVFVVFTNRHDLAPQEITPIHLQSLLKSAGLPLLPEAPRPLQNILRRIKGGNNSADRAEEMANQLSLIGKRLVKLEKSLNRLEEATQKRGALKREGKAIAALTHAEFVSLCRAACQAVYVGNNTILCRVLGHYFMYVDSQDMSLAPHLCLNGYWEPSVTFAFARSIQPGWNCIDVGANHGYFSLLMASIVGKTGKVLALEPNTNLVRMVQQTLTVNGFTEDKNVTVLSQAASDTDGEPVTLVVPIGQIGGASITRQVGAGDEAIATETVTLDRLTADWDHVDFIKIDTEGAEEAVWRGMRQTLCRNPNIIIVLEFGATRYPDGRAFLQEILNEGFILRYIDGSAEHSSLTVERCMTERGDQHWDLYLSRR